MKKKNKIKLLSLSILRLAFSVTEKALPILARRWAIKLFFSPIKFDFPDREKEILRLATTFKVDEKGVVQGYEWGKGPVVLFMHGWSGRATQGVEFIKSLVDAGFKVIAFDAPAHGKSIGKQTNLLEIKEAIFEITKKRGPLFGAIGHSLGGTALLLARKEGLSLEKLIVISVPSIAAGIIQEFLRKIGASQKIGESIERYVFKRFNRSFEELSASNIVSDNFPNTSILIVHDRDDKEAPIVHFQTLAEKLPYSNYLLTNSFGHTKILRSKEVVDSTIEFLKAEKQADFVDNDSIEVQKRGN